MGWTYEITAWMKTEDGYQDVYQYQGESLFAAIMAMLRARKHSKCVRFTWRG